MKQVSDRKCGVATKLGYVTLSWTGVTQQKRERKKSKKKREAEVAQRALEITDSSA